MQFDQLRRREFITLLGGTAAALPLAARAQQPERMRRIGLIASAPLRPVESFRRKLQELGYAEGKNLVIEYRFAQGRDDQYPAFASELAALPVDIIVTWGTPAVFAAKRATTKIPIVFVAGDAVNTGIVSNLAHPEGNVTGFVALNVELEEKRLELLKEILPALSRLAVLGNSLNPLNRINLETVRRVAQKLGITLDTFEVRNNQGRRRFSGSSTRGRMRSSLLPTPYS
jgi:putative ABC transport system substrate-binding protein